KTAPGYPPADWQVEQSPVAYGHAVSFLEERGRLVREQGAKNRGWLLEHSPLYTAGTSANVKDLINPAFPVYQTGRGGQYTYHGPGQRIAYVMMDLQRFGRDVRCHVWRIEEWIIAALARFSVEGERRDGRIGVWVIGRDARGNITEDKIAAIGVRVRRWV